MPEPIFAVYPYRVIVRIFLKDTTNNIILKHQAALAAGPVGPQITKRDFFDRFSNTTPPTGLSI